MANTVAITSFGYLHGPAPTAHITIDLRAHFRDPHVSPEMRHLTARDHTVQAAVLATPGIHELLQALADTIHAYQLGPSPAPITIATGCAGGRHRAAVVATELQLRLTADGIDSTLTHRDLDKPVVDR